MPSFYDLLKYAKTGIASSDMTTYDKLHSADAGVTIPTARGTNTLTVDTDLKPSEMTITGHIKPST